MSLTYGRIVAMVKVLEKSAKPDLELIARLKIRARETRESIADAQAKRDLEAFLALDRGGKK